MCRSKGGSYADDNASLVGGLYFTLGIWLHSSGMLPRTCHAASSSHLQY